MKLIAKKTGVLLLLVFAAIPLFYTLVFRVEQLAIRQKMKEKLESQLLHTITIASKDVRWIEEGKEIMINGEMFDIRSSSFVNGYYSFTGLYDKEETVLINQLEKTQQTSSSNSKILSELLQWLQSVYTDSQPADGFTYINLDQKSLLVTPALPEQFLGIVISPPKAA